MPLTLLAIAVPLAAFWSKGMTITGLLIVIPILGVALAIAIRRAALRLEESLASIAIVLDSDTLLRRQMGLEDISIQKSEVTSIREARGRGLTIRTRDRKRLVGIPMFLDRYDELRDHLSSWHPIDSERFPGQLATVGATVGVLALFGTFISSNDTTVVVTSGIILFVLMSGALIYLCRSRYVDQRTKRHLWGVVLVLIMIAVRVYGAIR